MPILKTQWQKIIYEHYVFKYIPVINMTYNYLNIWKNHFNKLNYLPNNNLIILIKSKVIAA
jgi:hypothetical protein